MATLTTTQQNTLWDDRFESIKQSCDGTYDCYRFASRLDGHNYYLHYPCGDEIITDIMAPAEVETQVKADLATTEYLGVKEVITTEEI